jgi:transposase
MRDWKVMMILAVHNHRVIAYDILDEGETVDGDRFKRFLIGTLRPKLTQARVDNPVILMDNARPHYHRVVTDFLMRRDWEVLKHPAYSPDMNPCDFDAIHRIKSGLKRISFPSPATLVAAYDKRIRELNEAHSFPEIYNLPRQWENIVANNGSYT